MTGFSDVRIFRGLIRIYNNRTTNQGAGSLSQDLIFNIPGDYDKNLLKLQKASNPILFFGIIFLVVIKLSRDFILSVFRSFKFGTPEDHPDLGQSFLAGDPMPNSKKWKFLCSVHGNPDIKQLQAIYHYDKTDNCVEPYILNEGSRLIKG
jgi:hypothetical protein